MTIRGRKPQSFCNFFFLSWGFTQKSGPNYAQERGTTIATAANLSKPKGFQLRHLMWAVYVLMMLFVALTRERTLLDAESFFRRRYEGFGWLVAAHGIPLAFALILGMFQFSARLRRDHLQLHRWMGRIYVGTVFVGAPLGPFIAHYAPMPTGQMLSSMHAFAWMSTTAIGLYCVRNGNIQQHREWMTRSYPFAMVFVVARVFNAIPQIERAGPTAIMSTVWMTLFMAALLPSMVIEWQAIRARKRVQARAAVASMATAD